MKVIRCNAPLTRKKTGRRLGWRCTKPKCRSFHCVPNTNKFFTYRTKEGKGRSNFKLSDIIRIAYYQVTATEMKLQSIEKVTVYRRQTLVDWHSMIRKVDSLVIARKLKVFGSGNHPIQVDEALFRGKRKNSKGRLWLEGKKDVNERELQKREFELHSHEDLVTPNRQSRDTKVGMPWVVAFYESRKNIRFEIVENCSSNILWPLFHKDT